jgi:hypothetical protein
LGAAEDINGANACQQIMVKMNSPVAAYLCVKSLILFNGGRSLPNFHTILRQFHFLDYDKHGIEGVR